MNRTSSRLSDGKPDVEKAKRIYRAAVETIHRLDDIQRQKKAYRDVFRQDAVGLRTRLKEYCERLMFYDPALYGRKAEEVLWRKVFYDIIQLIKHNKRHIRPNSSVENAFRTHLAAATGYYYHLLFRLQQEFNLNFNGILDFYLLPLAKSGSRFVSHRKRESDKAIKEWATKACHRCLVYLGDIARYQHSFGDGFSVVTADRYYHQALALFPDLGMPHNQLGTMASSRFYNCEAAYHYIRCLVSELSFEGAVGNLDRLFEKSSKRFQEVAQDAPRDLPPDQQRHRDVKRFLVRFMYLLSIFFKNSQSYDSYEIQDQCQRALQDFDLCMYYEVSLANGEDASDHHPSHLDEDIVFKIVIISMAAIYYQQKNGSRQVAASIAFLLALASHILNHVISRLQRALQEAENPTTLPHVDAEEFQLRSNKHEPCVENGEDVFLQNGTINVASGDVLGDINATKEPPKQGDNQQAQKRKMSRLRSLRRRRCHESDSDSCSSSLGESDLSEGGEGSDDDLSLSDESDDDFIDCLAHDSDSDFEENLENLDNKDEHPRLPNSGSTDKLGNSYDQKSSSQELLYNNNNTDSGSSPGAASDGANSGLDQLSPSKNVWSKEGVDDNLILFSSELFTASSSTRILTQNIRNASSNQAKMNLINGESLPNGDSGPCRQQHPHQELVEQEEELQERLDSFVIETDTETVIPTDTENSINASDSEAETEVEEQSSVSSNLDKWDSDRQSLLLDVIQGERLLPVVKVICDWMKCHAHVITTCAQSSQSLWNRLAVLLNFLPTEEEMTQDPSLNLTVDARLLMEGIHDLSWQQRLPLTEDFNLQCFVPLHDVHSSIDFSAWSRAKVKEDTEHVLRASCLRQFGCYLSNLAGVDFNYQADEKIFLVPSQSQSPVESKTTLDRMVSAETRRNQLMRDMAQLRLQAEVNQLEGSLQSEDVPTFPPYLIPDSSVLCHTLPVIRQLTQTARCIVIIPLAVIDTLDMLKKESSGAREAIRWLEGEFRKGNRYIRAQKANERAGMPPKANLKKKHREIWCLQELLNCGAYLHEQSGQLGGSSVITVLTTGDVNSLENMAKVKSLIHTCKQKGISIESMGEFQSKWKNILEGKG